jgi:hypothetical protein
VSREGSRPIEGMVSGFASGTESSGYSAIWF